MPELLFDNISRIVELLVQSPDGEVTRGQINLTAIYWQDGDFILHGTGLNSKQSHQFPLSRINEIVDIESGENVNVAEFRAELEAHAQR